MLAFSVLGSACGGESTELGPPRMVPGRLRLGADGAQRHGFGPSGARPAAAAEHGLTYEVPGGWRAQPPAPMQVASFACDGGAEASLSILAGDGGGLQSNVDRWRGQMGLPPMAAGELEALPRTAALGREDAVLVDLRGRFTDKAKVEQRGGLLGVVVARGSSTVFVKLIGPEAAVDAQRAAFTAFVATLGDGSRAHPPAAPPPDMKPPEKPAPVHPAVGAEPPTGSGKLRWQVPAGWTLGAKSSMRVVTFHPRGERAVHAYVVVMPGTAGGLKANLDRWCEQVGKPPVVLDALARIRVLGEQVPLLVEANDTHGVVGVMTQLGEDSLFVKMVGPPEEVMAAKADFIAFCTSLEVRP